MRFWGNLFKITFFFLLGVQAYGAQTCSSFLGDDSLVTRLVRLGYERSVAERLVQYRVSLVDQILSNEKAGLPVSVFRGLVVEPHDYDPSYDSHHVGVNSVNTVHTTTLAPEAISYSVMAERNPQVMNKLLHADKTNPIYTLVLRYQLPHFLLTPGLTFNRKKVGDERAFISEVGFVPISTLDPGTKRARDEKARLLTRWVPYDDAFRGGKL